MSEDIKKTFEEIKSTFEELKKADKAKDQDLEKKGVELGEHKQKIDRISEHLDKLQEKVEKAEVEAKRKPIGNEEVMHFESRKNYVRKLAEAVKTGSKMDAEGRELQEKAFFDYYRAQKENAHLNDAEIKSMSVISDPNGGYTVMPDTSGRITQRIYETSPLRQVASVTTIGTDALEGFFDDNEASAGWVGEVESRSETNTPEIGKYRIPVEEMYAKPKVSQKLLEDSMWNIENFLVGKVANKFSRLENTAFITGTGTNQPMGILSYTAATAAGTYERNKIGQVASGVSGSLNMDSIISLQETLKQEWQVNGYFGFNRATRAVIRKLKDGDNNYLWQPSNQLGVPDLLHGKPVIILEDMPDLAANALAVVFADFAEAYQIVDRIGISVLRDIYSAKPYVELYCRKRVGAAVINFDAIKILKCDS